MLLPILLHLLGNTIALDPTVAQRSADALIFLLQAPGNCLISATDLPANAPSKNLAALWIRAAFHDAGTFDASNTANPGGANGGLVYTTDMTDNLGLENTLANQRITSRQSYNISNADLIALGGAVTVTHCGGPNITFRGGRVDVNTSTTPIPLLRENVARLPSSLDDYPTVKSKMLKLGFSFADIVALVTGSHSMGGVHKAISPTLTDQDFTPFDDTPGVFDNNVFKKSLQGKCALKLDCDIANDPDTRPFVQLYASDQNAFFKQYAESFPKMISLTSSNLDPPIDIKVPVHEHLVKEGTVVNNSSSSGTLSLQAQFALLADEAIRCLDISKSKFANGNSEAAIKFVKKSISLHSTPNAVEWLEFISKTSIQGTRQSTRQRRRSPSPKKEESRPYTQEQVDGINKIKRFKAKGDLYSILGVTKAAQENEIKKAYRKVALLYHPDKCTAPGADDAFKGAIGHAFAVLGDKEKRAAYDMFGSESASASGMGRRTSNPFGTGHGFHPNSNFTHFESEVSPEELFNMFFGPGSRGPRPAFRTDGPQFSRNTSNRQRRTPEFTHVNRSANYLQLLPVFFLLLFTFISWISGGLGGPEFSFSQSNGLNYQLFTQEHKVRFYMDPWNYNSKYKYSPQRLRQLERQVERQYYQNLQYRCSKEREERNYKMATARGWFEVNTKEYQKAKDMKLPSCDELRSW